MSDFSCFNHKYPLCMLEKKVIFKKFFGRVRRVEITCHCPGCGMEITYSFKIERYKKGKEE